MSPMGSHRELIELEGLDDDTVPVCRLTAPDPYVAFYTVTCHILSHSPAFAALPPLRRLTLELVIGPLSGPGASATNPSRALENHGTEAPRARSCPCRSRGPSTDVRAGADKPGQGREPHYVPG